MWQDPIVQEVRKAGEDLARQSEYNIHTFFKNLRNNEKKQKSKVVSRINVEKQNTVEFNPCLTKKSS